MSSNIHGAKLHAVFYVNFLLWKIYDVNDIDYWTEYDYEYETGNYLGVENEYLCVDYKGDNELLICVFVCSLFYYVFIKV